MAADSRNYYELLGVPPNATPQEIKTAYRNLARQYHPDVRDTDEDAHADEMLKQINVAYEVLGDPLKRARYDRQERERWRVPPANSAYYAADYPAQRHGHNKIPVKLLFFAISFVLVMSMVMTAVLVAFTPMPQKPKTVEEFYGEQTQTVTARRIAAINRLPTNTPAPELLRRAWTPNPAETSNYALPVIECTLDLEAGERDCEQENIETITGDGETTLKVSMIGYIRAQFEVQLAEDGPYDFAIADDLTENSARVGMFGDRRLTIFANRPSIEFPVVIHPNMEAGTTLLLEIADQRVAWAIEGQGEEILSRDLFALHGQADGSGEANRDIYAMFNSGVARVTIRLYSPVLLRPTPSPTVIEP
ncbi:MAG: DnaJ domain-containing protein [Anaerolineae bacterium]|nr:DnaJ domain-containing protein [Anaerolineae bacterium]